MLRRREVDNDARRRLDCFLGVSGPPDEDLMRIDATRMKGSGQWIFERVEFQQWQNGLKNQLYRVNAPPATGKSVLAGAVIPYLKSFRYDCSYYFFDYSNK